jgi:uncharacterized RDD family membrane protein YckC
VEDETEGGSVVAARKMLEEARQKEKQGDLRSAFLLGQNLLIDHHGEIPEDLQVETYLLMAQISLQQGKRERAVKYLQKVRVLDPGHAELQPLLAQLTAPAAPAPAAPGTVTATTPSSAAPEPARAVGAPLAGPPASPRPAPPPVVPPVPPPVPVLPIEPEEEPKPARPLPSVDPETLPLQEQPTQPPRRVKGERVDRLAPVQVWGRLAWAASFWWRAAAFSIDLLLVLAVVLVTMVLSSVLLGDGLTGVFRALGERPAGLGVVAGLFVAALLIYATLFGRFGGQTVGKMVLRLRVVGLDGHSLSTLHALLRAAGMLLAALPGLAGFLWAGFDRDRRGWHDHLGRSLVVRVNPPRGAA